MAADFLCRLCSGKRLEFYYALGNDGQFRYYRCADCALVNYDLSGGLDQEQYTSRFIDPTDDENRKNREKDQSFAFLSRYVGGGPRFMDIGCGNGRLLYLARRAGWRVKGLELSAETAARVRDLLGIDVQAGDFLDSEFDVSDRGRFDVVSLRHVLEHLPDPWRAIDRVNALLKPGGYLLLEMPNVEGWAKKFNRAIVNRGWHRRQFPEDFAAGHCNEYCRQSLGYLAELGGYEVVRWETYSKKPVANWILNRVPVGTKARTLLKRM